MKNNSQLQLEAKLFKGLADPSRLAILESISTKSKTVSEIVEETQLSQPSVSMHLSCLLGCGLVHNKKEGRNSYYQVSGNELKEVITAAQKIISQHSKEMYECTQY